MTFLAGTDGMARGLTAMAQRSGRVTARVLADPAAGGWLDRGILGTYKILYLMFGRDRDCGHR
jgi:hypothetical protein